MIIGTSQTWGYINSQMDSKRRYAVHISDEEGRPICHHGGELDDTDDVPADWFIAYPWACKHCLRLLANNPSLYAEMA